MPGSVHLERTLWWHKDGEAAFLYFITDRPYAERNRGGVG